MQKEQHLQYGEFLNIAAVCSGTQSLGPGLRAAIWVQGCLLHCQGCFAPDWIPFKPNRLVHPDDLLDEILVNPLVSGLTFSGGEPFQQAFGLAKLAAIARQRRDLDIICFTGYTLENLLRRPPSPGTLNLLAQLDVLIDGPYIEERNNNLGLKGSTNQKVHHLSGRLEEFNFDLLPRSMELHIGNGYLLAVGVPPAGVPIAIDKASSRMQSVLVGVESERA